MGAPHFFSVISVTSMACYASRSMIVAMHRRALLGRDFFFRKESLRAIHKVLERQRIIHHQAVHEFLFILRRTRLRLNVTQRQA